MSSDLSYIDRLTQRYERSGTSLFIRTYLKDTLELVNEFEFTGVVPGAPIPIEVQAVARNILSDIARLGPAVSPIGSSIDASGATVLVGADKTFKATDIYNSVLLVGDSMTARHFHYHIASGAGSLVGSPNTDVTWPIVAGTNLQGQAAAGSRCRVTAATTAALNTWATVVTQNSTTMTVRYDFDTTGMTPGTATIWLEQLRGDSGYFNYVRALHRLDGINSDWIENQGIGGDTFAKMTTRYATDIAPYLPCRVALMSGFNEAVNVVAGTVTQAQVLANARTLIERLLADGATIDLVSAIPFTTGASGVSTNEAAAIACLKAINAQHQGYANKYPARIRYIDAWTAVKNAGTDYADTGMISGADKIHPCQLGASAIAGAYVTATAGSWIDGGVFTSLSNDDDFANGGLNCFVNPMLQGTGGSHSGGTWSAGTVPDSCVVTLQTGTTVTAAASVARPMGGFDYDITFDTAGANWAEFSQDISANGVVGTSRRCSVEIETLVITNSQYLNAAIEYVDGGVTQHILLQRHLTTTANGQNWPPVGTRYRFESDEFTIPATATGINFRVVMAAGAAATGLRTLIGCPQVW